MSETFPIQQCGRIPMVAAERAYETYRRLFGGGQSLTRLGERAGFGLNEWACLYLGHDPCHHDPARCIWKALVEAGMLTAPI